MSSRTWSKGFLPDILQKEGKLGQRDGLRFRKKWVGKNG